MVSIPGRLRRPALLALVALVTVGGSMAAASAQTYGGSHGRLGDDWQPVPGRYEGRADYPRQSAYPYGRSVYSRAYPAPAYYGGGQAGFDSEPSYYGGYQDSDDPDGGNDTQDFDRSDDEGRAQSGWRDDDDGYDEDE